MDLTSIRTLLDQEEFDRCLNEIEKVNEADKTIAKVYKSLIFKDKGKFDNAIEIADEVINAGIEQDDRIIKIGGIMAKAYAVWKKGELISALSLTNEGLDLLKTLDENQKIEVLHWNATLLNIRGLIFWQQGHLKKAMIDHKNSLELREIHGTEFEKATSLNNIALIYRDMGDSKHALEFFNQSLAILEEINNFYYQGIALGNIGIIYHDYGEFNKSIDFLERSLQLKKEMDNPVEIAETLFWLTKIHIELDNVKTARSFYQELDDLNERTKNDRIILKKNLAHALLLMKGNRLEDMYNARKNLLAILQNDVLEHKYTTLALIKMCELLLEELSITGAEEILDEIREYLNVLDTQGTAQNSKFILSETFLLKAKLALIDFEFIRARKFLKIALDIAEKNDLDVLAMKISNQYDEMIHTIDKLTRTVEDQLPLEDRVDILNLNTQLDQFIQSHELSSIEEDPLLVMILSNSGVSIFSHSFSEKTSKGELMAGVLSAINSLMEEIFDTKGIIDRIVYLDYTVLVKPVDSLLFCYIFEGRSFFADKKLERFIDQIRRNHDLWQILEEKIYGLTDTEKKYLNKCVEDIFFLK